MYRTMKKLALSFIIFNVFMFQSLMADMMFYYSAAILPSIISSSQEAKLKNKLAGNTLYTSIYNEISTLESWAFNEELTNATWTELEGGSESGTGELNIDGMTLTFTEDVDSDTVVVSEILEDYMLIAVNEGKMQRLYYDEAKARAYFIDNALENYFIGQTKYYANENGGNGYRTYDPDGTYVGVVGTTPVDGTYTISGNTLTLNRTGGTVLEFTHVEHNEGGEVFDLSVNGGTSFITINYPDDFLVDYFTGQRRDFENEFGTTGYRIYNENATFTGEVGDPTVSGTYAIDKYTIILYNSDDTVSTLTHKGSDNVSGLSIQVFLLDKNDGTAPFEIYQW